MGISAPLARVTAGTSAGLVMLLIIAAPMITLFPSGERATPALPASADGRPGGRGQVREQCCQLGGDRTGMAGADPASVQREDWRQAAHRAGDEQLVGGIELSQAEVADNGLDARLRGEVEHRLPGDPLRAGGGGRRAE